MVPKQFIYMKGQKVKNKKGFAISTMLYGLVFVTIAIFYMIITLVGDRYEDNNTIVEEVRTQLNGL